MALNERELRDQYSPKTEELQRKLKESRRLFADYKKTHGRMELFIDEVLEFIEPIAPSPILYDPDAKQYKVHSPCVQVAHAGDWHYGAVQESDEIEGFGEFSPEICHDRALVFARKVVDRGYLQRHNMRVDEIHIICTGDMISGDIHHELQVTNAFPVPMQVVRVADLFSEFVTIIASQYKKVVIHYLVADNHSRKTKKPQAKQEGVNSENYIIGKIAEHRLSQYDNIEFNIYPQFEKVIHVGKMQYLISHGHNLRGWMGIPWYSYQRHVGKEATARMSQIMDSDNLIQAAARIGFHKLLTGHFHTPFDHPLYCCCGSMSGTDAYDHKDGRHAGPSQSSWFVHPKWGEFDRTNFSLK